MGSPKTREIAGLVWTWKPDYETWTTETGLYVIRYDAPPGSTGGVDYLAPGPDEMFSSLVDACKAEVRWHAGQGAEAPPATPDDDTAIEDWPAAQSASPTLEPEELDRMIGEDEPTTPMATDPMAQVIALVLDGEAKEREAQRRDLRAYYRNVAGWAVAVLVLVALCSGVLRG